MTNSIRFGRDKFDNRIQVGDNILWTPTRDHAGIPGRVAQCREDGLLDADVIERGRMTLRPSEIEAAETSAVEQELRAQTAASAERQLQARARIGRANNQKETP